MKKGKQQAHMWAKTWARYLGITDKHIEVVQSDNEFYEVKVLKDGAVIPESLAKKTILDNGFDTIRIILGKPTLLKQLPKWVQKQQFIEAILHELLHIKNPMWNEEKVRDESAEIIGKLMEGKIRMRR